MLTRINFSRQGMLKWKDINASDLNCTEIAMTIKSPNLRSNVRIKKEERF
jgi:hypothetical protein